MGSLLDSLLVYYVFGSCALFAAGYSVLARGWWRSLVGLAMGLRDLVIPAVLLPQVLHFALGVGLGVAWFHWYWRVSLFALGTVSLWRLWVIWYVQRRDAHQGRASSGSGGAT